MNELTTFVIPEGFELKKTGENQYTIAKKETKSENPNNNFFNEVGYDVVSNNRQRIVGERMGVIRDEQDYLNYLKSSSRINDKRYFNEYCGDTGMLEGTKINLSKVPKLTRHEYQLLQFCDSINVKEFLKEEFEKNPIKLGTTDDGFFELDK